jgi:hypothetical protein
MMTYTNLLAFVPDLETLRDLFTKYGRTYQSGIVDQLLSDGRTPDREKFVSGLQGGLMWGGSGSVADAVSLIDPPRTPEAELDSVSCRRALLRIADEMEAQGISSEGSRFIGSALKRGLDTTESE